MRGDGFSCFPCSLLRVPYLWAFIGSSFVFINCFYSKKKKKKLGILFLKNSDATSNPFA